MRQRKSAALTALFITMTPVLAGGKPLQRGGPGLRARPGRQHGDTHLPAPRLVETRVEDLTPGTAFLGTNYEMDLTAVSLRTHRTLAQATCDVNFKGEVLSIKPRPLASL